MMKTKAIELRDEGTFIPCVAILMGHAPGEDAERYLLRRAGYGSTLCVLLTSMEGGRKAQYDPYAWGDRTFTVAHQWITDHWDEIYNGDVVDVQFILGETSEPKVTERACYVLEEDNG